MRDGRTQSVQQASGQDGYVAFMRRWEASVVITAGGVEGSEFRIERLSSVLGRGEEADLRFPEDAGISSQHAVLEFADGGYRLRDLGSSNGTFVNDARIEVTELKNGDRIRLGDHVLEFVIQERARTPRTYTIPEE